ncbi:MAG: hypothetical protein WCH34_01385 [Bacteroidota bacterium]
MKLLFKVRFYTFSSDSKTFTNGLKTSTNDSKTFTSGLKTFTNDSKTFTSGLKTFTNDLKTFTSGLKTSTNGLKTFTNDLKTSTNGLKTFTSDLKDSKIDLFFFSNNYIVLIICNIKNLPFGHNSETEGFRQTQQLQMLKLNKDYKQRKIPNKESVPKNYISNGFASNFL